MSGRASSPDGVRWALVAPAVALVLLLGWELVGRIPFPWDGYIWSETPFMTDMLKLTAGQPVYTNIADANSMIYSPGLAYLTYGVLRPFGLQVDVRFCRAVCVAVGGAGALCAAGFMNRAVVALGPADSRTGGTRWRVFAIAAAVLVVFKNHTSDALHPDNLYILHAAGTLLLTSRAFVGRRYSDALIAVAFAAAGILAKQTAVLSVGGVAALLVVTNWKSWRVPRVLGLLAVGAVVVSLAAWPLVRNANARFFAFELVSHHPLEIQQLKLLFSQDITGVPHRAILYLTGAPALFYVLFHSNDRVRRLFVPWLVVGVFEVLPSLASYFKILGTPNSLFIVDLWLALAVVPLAWTIATRGDSEAPSPLVRAGAAGLLLLLVVALVPSKMRPSAVHWKTLEQMDAAVAQDLRDGKRILVSSAVMPQVHAGRLDVPLDREACTWELGWAERLHLASTNGRLRDRYYDKVYVHTNLHHAETRRLIEAGYVDEHFIEGDNKSVAADELMFGFQGFQHAPIRIMTRRP